VKNKNFRSAGYCEWHYKQLYLSRKVARQVAHLHQGQHKAPYRCEVHQGCWHIGDLAKDIIRGRYDREDFYGKAS
jgi:hypothetical protein